MTAARVGISPKAALALPLGPQWPWASVRSVGHLAPPWAGEGKGLLRPLDGHRAPRVLGSEDRGTEAPESSRPLSELGPRPGTPLPSDGSWRPSGRR